MIIDLVRAPGDARPALPARGDRQHAFWERQVYITYDIM